jgi:hypothetical protein
MKKSGLLFVLVCIAATVLLAQPPQPGGWGGRGRGGPEMLGLIAAGPGSQTPVTGAPYSAVEITTIQQKLGDGNQISRTNQSKVYRDSTGRVRIEHSFTPPNATAAQTRVTIFDPVAGSSYTLNPSTSQAVKMALPQARTAKAGQQGMRNHLGGSDVVTTDLGTQTVNGVVATGTRTTRTIPAGAIGNAQAIQIVREVWISTALKVPVEIKTTDPRFGSTTMDVTNIVQTEPSADLFVVPSNYTVTTGTPRGPNAMGRPGMRQ